MIIVSQDKVANINYNNIEATYLLKKDDEVEINVRGNYDYTIGKYKTEERAKEVLQGIIRVYEKAGNIAFETDEFKTDENETAFKITNNSNVFEMPED